MAFSPEDANNHCRNPRGSRQLLSARRGRIEYTAGTGPSLSVIYQGDGMKQTPRNSALLVVLLLAGAGALRAQAPEGPLAPRPGQPVQQVPQDVQAQLKVRVALVNMPVTVRNSKGEMV